LPFNLQGYKRAVYRAAPLKFSIDMLSPTKFGSSYNFGMRISPLVLGDRSSSAFTASSSSFEYDIWRKWEDCLIFQGNIETEYRRMARSKRTRLERGKGVRRNGFYKQDAASSWESLPPGPDPKSVAADVHEYIPTLTRKGTIFRASQATIDQRATEFKAFVEALWREDVPALIDEMRNDHLVRDFFSYWRRDHEMSEKQRKQRAKNSTSRTSVTSSIFSMYFSSSNLNIQNLREDHPEPTTTSRSTSTFRSSRNSLEPSRYRKGSTSSNEDSSTSQGRGRAYSTSSSNSSPSTLSDSSLDSPVQVNAPIPTVADNVSTIAFDHNPQRNVHHVHERPTSGLAVLLENQEACLKTNTPPYLSPNDGKRRKSSCGDPDRRGRIFLSLPDVPSSVEDELFPIDENSVRNSWQTIDSTSCILEGLDHFQECSHRESTSTMATFMTDATADGVLARERESSPSHVKLKHKSRIVSGPISLSEFDFDHEFSDSDESDDILDMFLTADSFPMPCSDIPHIEFPEVLMEPVEQCPVTPSASEFTNDEQSTLSNCFRVPLSAEKPTTFSSKSLAPIPDQFNIKAKFNDSLVFLRVPDEISYKDLRQRLFNKFVGQEGIALSDSFKITFLQPVIKDLATSNPDNSSRPSSANTDDHVPYPVASADDWENVAASVEGCKLALLITDDTL
ncbi:hypothetical protein J132_10029, partial [Termitomyces sp. J132]